MEKRGRPIRPLLFIRILNAMDSAGGSGDPTMKLSSDEALIEAKRRIAAAKQTGEEQLDLSISGLVQIPPLDDLPSVRSLFLLQTEVSDIEQVARLTNLNALTINYGSPIDLSPLSVLSKLEFLDLTGAKISGLSPIADLRHLRTLGLVETRITDLAPLSALSALERLYLSHTWVSDLSPLSGLSRLQRLSISRTKVTSLAALAQMQGLHLLYLKSTAISNFAELADLKAIRSLHLNDTSISNLEPLAKIPSLRFLNLAGTRVVDLTPLAKIDTLRSIIVENTEVEDISPLAGLTALQTLNISATKVSDLTALADLTALVDGAVAFLDRGGLAFSSELLRDESLQALARLRNPERTIKTIEYLRETTLRPHYPEPRERLSAVSRSIAAGRKPVFGSESEIAARIESAKSVAHLEAELERYRDIRSSIGHNHPPESIFDENLEAPEQTTIGSADLTSLDRIVIDLKVHFANPTPDPSPILDAVEKLNAIQGRLVGPSHSRWETAKDKFVEGFSDEAGRGLAKALTWALCGAVSAAFLSLLAWLYAMLFIG